MQSRLLVAFLTLPACFVHVVRFDAHPPSSFASLPLHGVEAQRHAFIRQNEPVAPSSSGKFVTFSKRQALPNSLIYCNRPHATAATIPATLLHAAFGQFLDDCERHEITAADNSFAQELSIVMSDFYVHENVRADTIRGVFSKWGLPFIVSHTSNGYVTDGDMSVNGCRYAIAEFKNEVGSTGAEPYCQANLYYLDATRKYATMMGCWPCIIVLLFGPYLAFAGATWNLRPVVQTLSCPLQMHYHPTDTDMRTRVARHLGALQKVTRTLEEYYRGLTTPIHPASSRLQTQLFPHPTYFTPLQYSHQQDFDQQHFEYSSQPFQHKLIFFGKLSNQQPICIKFVRQYSKDAHWLCASVGCAPTLHGFEAIPGGWFMVVMDRLSGEYVELHEIIATAPPLDSIRKALTQLHQKGYVHGDIRTTNIMVSRSDPKKFMLIDFDWAGKIGEVLYPMNVYRGKKLWRPVSAVDGCPITADHDMDMLDHIAGQYLERRADIGMDMDVGTL
ncbi:hypothetical protein BU15DRAFT_51454 [Melanogaster broomeanus]|nr:hypothetical protein BU15DRAFT_51454 [Melanogaster broomeanus]